MSKRGNKTGAHFLRLTESDKKDILDMTLDGKTPNEIASYIGCSAGTVRLYRTRHGFGNGYKRTDSWSDEDTEKMIEMYLIGKSAREIGDAVGRTASAVSSRMRKLRSIGYITYYKTKRPDK